MRNTLILILVASISVGFMSFLWGMNYGEDKEQQNQLEKEKEAGRLLVEEQQKKGEYDLILNEVCSKAATESSVLDLYKCKTLKQEEWYYSDLGIDEIRADIDVYKTIVLCDSNIAKLTLAEVADCLNYGNSEFE